MARPVDEKIVVMKMDNSDLVSKAAETTSLFGKLKNALTKIPGINLGKTAEEMGSIKNQVNGTNFDALSNSVQMVAGRFTTMGMIGVTALTNITNRAIDAGLAISKSLTVDQVSDGFREYELKMKSIGTMLANTEWAGSTLDDVKGTLGELNDYADKTIYSFAEMTSSIGRFTAAGVTLEDSAIAIKGLGNLAAVSGSTSEQLNTAMYQASQALASGKLTLEDWNSMVNAGMGGKKTQDALVATAKAMGKNINLTDGFRNSIQDGWLTSEVFLETLKKFGADESMTKAATSVRTFSGAMDALKEGIGSGWAETFEHIFGDFEEATVLWTRLSEGVSGWFGKTSDARNELVKGIADGGGFLNIFAGIENAVVPVLQVFEALGNGFKRVFPPASVAQIVKMTATFKSFTAGLKMNEVGIQRLTTIFQGGFSVFSTVIEIVKSLGSAFLQLIPPGVGGGIFNLLERLALMAIVFNKSVKEGNGLTKTIDGLGKILGTIGESVRETINSIITFSGSLKENLGRALDWIQKKLAPVGSWFKEAFSDFGGDDLLGAGTLAGVIALVTMFGAKILGIFDSFGDIGEGLADALEGAGDAIKGFAMGIKTANLMLIATALLMLTISLKTLEGIKTEDITKGLTALAVSLGVMMAGLAVISKFNLVGGLGASVTIVAIATSVTIMASALKKISDMNPEELKQGMIGLVGIVGTLSVAIIALSKLGGKVAVGSLQLIALSTAVVILAEAVEKMAAIDSGELKTSITALAAIFGTLAIFLKVVSGSKLSLTSALGLIAVAGAVQMMVTAINQISGIDTASLIAGLTTIGLILAQIAIFSKVAGGPGMLLAGAGIILIATAINMLVPPIQTLGEMSLEELAKGLGAMAIALLSVAAAGLLASGSIGGAIAITIMAGALTMLLDPIQKFANMTWGELIKGLVGMGASLAVVAGASILLAPAVPAMLGFGAALALLGVAVLAAGAGLALLGTGLATLATLTLASVASIVSALGLLIKGLGTLIVDVVDFIVKLGIALIDGIRKLVPPLADTIVYLIVKLLEVISNHLPRFLELGVKIIVQLMEGIAQYTPILVSAAIKCIIDLINGMADAVVQYGPELIAAVFNLLGSIILLVIEAGIQTINALLGWIPGVEKAMSAIGKGAEEYLRSNFGAAVVGAEKGNEFSSSFAATQSAAKTAGTTVGGSAKSGLESVDYLTAGSQAGNNFANGIMNSKGTVNLAARNMGTSAVQSLNKSLGVNSPAKETIKSGGHTGDGFAKGMDKKKKTVKKSAKNLASAAKEEFNKKMDTAEYKFKMGTIDSAQYIKEIEKIKGAYSKYPELVQKANLEIKKIEEDAAKHKADLIKKEFDKSKAEISERKYYNQMSLEEELKTWQKIQARYKEGTEQRKEADREVYRLKKDLQKKEFDDAKTAISDKKNYNQLSLADELKTWESLRAKYKQGTDERKEADREVYRLKNEINSKLLAMNEEYVGKMQETNQKLIDGIKSLNDEYDQELKSLTSSLTNFAGIFDEVTKKQDVSGQQLLDNLKGQVTTFTEWSENIKSLASKGIDDGLLEELRTMGPKAASEIAALNTLTESQLVEYAGVWKTKNELAKTEATAQLEDLRKKTDEKITQLRTDSEKQLETYKKEWMKKIGEIRTGTVGEFVALGTDMNEAGRNTIQGLMTGMENMRGDLMDLAQSIANEISATINGALDINSPSGETTTSGEEVGNGLIVGMASKLKGIAKGAKIMAITAKDSLNQFLEGFEIPDVDNTIHIKAVLDYDQSNLDKLRKHVLLKPDTSFATAALTSTERDRRESVYSENKSITDNSRRYEPTIHVTSGPSNREIARTTERELRKLAFEFGV